MKIVKNCAKCDVILIPKENISKKYYITDNPTLLICRLCKAKTDRKIFAENNKLNGHKANLVCRYCKTMLNVNNCSPSFLNYEIMCCRKCDANERKRRYKENRKLVIEKLGGKCSCCGQTDYIRLSIDHITDNGGHDKTGRRLDTGFKFMKKAAKKSPEELSKKFQVLCFNCNYCIGFYGICAHKLK